MSRSFEGYSHVNEKLGFVLLVLQHNVRQLFVDLPAHVCSCLVVAVDVLSFSQFKAARDQMLNGLIETATQSAFGYPGCQRLFQRGFRFLSSLYSDPRENSRRTREKPLVPRVAFGSTSGFLRMLCRYQRVGRL